MIFEQRSERLIGHRDFLVRVFKCFVVTLVIVAVSLSIGSIGYPIFADLPWIDALLNAAMILTGMGPVNAMQTDGGKLFATFYALYSGIAFLSMIAVILAPLLHRLLHHFHLDEDD